MFIRVDFSDNDLGSDIERACEDFMFSISKGYNGAEAINLYEQLKKKIGLENIRKAIVLASYGNYISKQGYKWVSLGEIDLNVSKYESMLQYFDSHIKITDVKIVDIDCPNCETCIIDFYQMKVYMV